MPRDLSAEEFRAIETEMTLTERIGNTASYRHGRNLVVVEEGKAPVLWEDFFQEGVPEEGEADVTYRRRGRPKSPPGMKRRVKLIISVTEDEFARFMVASGKSKYRKVQDWARDKLNEAVLSEEE